MVGRRLSGKISATVREAFDKHKRTKSLLILQGDENNCRVSLRTLQITTGRINPD